LRKGLFLFSGREVGIPAKGLEWQVRRIREKSHEKEKEESVPKNMKTKGQRQRKKS